MDKAMLQFRSSADCRCRVFGTPQIVSNSIREDFVLTDWFVLVPEIGGLGFFEAAEEQ
jgi:hypothetical protein